MDKFERSLVESIATDVATNASVIVMGLVGVLYPEALVAAVTYATNLAVSKNAIDPRIGDADVYDALQKIFGGPERTTDNKSAIYWATLLRLVLRRAMEDMPVAAVSEGGHLDA